MSDFGDMFLEQKRIEEEATLTGIRRAARVLEKAREADREATTPVGSAMVNRIVLPMKEMLEADLEARRGGNATKGGSLLKVLRDLDPRLLCIVATREALARMSRTEKLTAIARRIGEGLEDELRWYRWSLLDKKQADAVRRLVNRSKSHHQRRNALAGFARRWEKRALDEAWSSYRLLGVGLRFVDYLVRLGVLELTKIPTRVPGKKRKAAHAVRLTTVAMSWAKEVAEMVAVSRPLSWPLVIPPVPWTDLQGGGFHFRSGLDHPSIPRPLKPLPLVRRACKEQRAMLAEANLTQVFLALNVAQSTSWRIHPRVYSTLARLWELGRGGPGITMADPISIPPRPAEADKDKQVHIAWKNKARKAHAKNAAMASHRLAEHRVFTVARKFCVYPQIYFAYNLDFRSRMYACSDDLSPQGNDPQRGLLEFSAGDPLTEDGVRWLKVHIANTYGIDKVSFEERIKWTEEHTHMILQCAANPLDCTEWHKADGGQSPWQFLAACFAYQDYHLGGIGTVCRVPVMLDGSCSGIQHYAALLRDEEAGGAVNLVPNDKPSDLYSDVLAVVIEKLGTSTLPFAREWKAWGITRKMVKRSVMVLPYGGTFLSNLDYVRDAVRDRIEKEGRPRWLPEDDDKEAFITLAQVVWQSMGEVVKGPIAGMNYVRKVVKLWAKTRGHRKLNWVSPSGFPVVTNYLARKVPDEATGEINGKPVSMQYYDTIDVTNWVRTESAAAPNFVHSLDAAHLALSLASAKALGITQVAVVHDAFGTTPSRTGEFSRVLRGEFAKLYSENPFEALRTSYRKLGLDAPAAPEHGALDPAAIAQSEYLFA